MSRIQAIIGGKKKGIADQVSIDPAFGCKNNCIGCYAKKSSQRGKNYANVKTKEFNKEVLQKTIRKAKNKGYHVARIGKHCDPGDHVDNLIRILECSNNESFTCVTVSKSLPFIDYITNLLQDEKHLLHMSIGPYSEIAPKEHNRIEVANNYNQAGATTVIRWTEDITSPMRENVKQNIDGLPYILTPMRYPSRKIMNFYGAQEERFDFLGGYWRPKEIHSDWNNYLDNICGEINGEDKCCNCLVDTI